MKCTALKRDTGLSETYYLDTISIPSGVIVTVYDQKRTCIGQYTDKRKHPEDIGPIENVIKYNDYKMNEVIGYLTGNN